MIIFLALIVILGQIMLNFAYRANEAYIISAIETPFITAILGPRRVGKTTLIQHYQETHPEHTWVLFNMDQMQQREKIKSGQLHQMIEQQILRLIDAGGKVWVTIDEAQKCPEVFDQIKILYDKYKDKDIIKFILTGSAILELHKLSAETLAGRIQLFHLYEFTLREQAIYQNTVLQPPTQSTLDILLMQDSTARLHDFIRTQLPLQAELQKTLKQEVVWGGLPEVISQNDDTQRTLYLENYLQTYLEKDIRAIETITDLPLYRNCLQLIAEQTGSLRDDTKLTNILGCARNTLKKYYGIMQSTLLVHEIYPFISSTHKRLVKAPKAYLINNGLISYLSSIDNISLLEKTKFIGHRFENWFLKEILVWLARHPKKGEVQFWHTYTGCEVDFIATYGNQVLPFEITYSNRKDNKKVRNLQSFLQQEPKATYGYYIYNGDFQIDEVSKIIYLPAWTIC